MSNLQLGRMTGLAVGIVVGLILVVVIMRAVNFNHKMKTEYDEMQRSIRDRGYKYGFYTILIVEALFCVVSSGMDIPAVPIVVHFIPIFLGIVVQASYCIWNNAYVGLNINMKRCIIVAVAASLINFLAAFLAWRSGTLISGHVIQAPFVNLLCGVMFAILGLVALFRKAAVREVEE